MRITKIDLQCYDYLWFAIDANGCIIAFTSGGIGDVPEFVCRSKSETKNWKNISCRFLVVLHQPNYLLTMTEVKWLLMRRI